MHWIKSTLAAGLIAASALASAQNIRATVNGTQVHFPDVQPMMLNGRVMVPLRGVFEHMGAQVYWNSDTRTVIVQNGTNEVRLPIGSFFATVDGNRLEMDAPARLINGRTMVPLRFTSEALNANVEWIAETRTVAINTMGAAARPVVNPPARLGRTIHIEANTVIPLRLETRLSSATARIGDRFRATVDPPNNMDNYMGLPAGTVVEGRVTTARPKEGNTPGVIGLDFDRVRLSDGTTQNLDGALIALDSKSVTNENGRIVAKAEARNNNMKYVGIGAGAGLILAILGKGDALTNALIGGALGFLFGEIERQQQRPRDVELEAGTKLGVRLTQDLHIRGS